MYTDIAIIMQNYPRNAKMTTRLFFTVIRQTANYFSKGNVFFQVFVHFKKNSHYTVKKNL